MPQRNHRICRCLCELCVLADSYQFIQPFLSGVANSTCTFMQGVRLPTQSGSTRNGEAVIQRGEMQGGNCTLGTEIPLSPLRRVLTSLCAR